MEKGEYKTGQLLGVKEKNGKLVQEYVAGFFGDEPIIKQRLLTPQESRRYREDLQRAKQQGKTPSEAASTAGAGKNGQAPRRKLVRRTKPGEPGPAAPLRKRKIKKIVATEQGGEAPRRKRPMGRAPEEAAASPKMAYLPKQTDSTADFIQNLIDNETDKPDYNPANTQKALDTISKIACPDMKIYRIGTKVGEKEGESYTQKEYIARDILGLPLWKPKVDEPEESESKEVEKVNEETPAPVEDSSVPETDSAVNSSENTEAAETAKPEVEVQDA